MNPIRISIVTLLVSLLCLAITAFAETDIDDHRDCTHCGMDRKAYGYSRMLVEYKDGRKVGTCSLHCAVTELKSRSEADVTFKVADRNSRELIAAEKAFWVIGGTKRGVMTVRAKWAFKTQKSADAFIQRYGGSPATWQDALAAAREDATAKPGR